ncbi:MULTISPECIES: ATP-binding protein [Streptosporangium]|uniref:Anti-sigma regulatory factor (Ser/Thr protein kinase) n=1 Tax=Streptosporangium brasiliense TaxID=47480 RepID=A0ABT9RNF6_9ACTN|nr:ATP-binding protein [Streptosporangium brasiliense]MDP9870366.1 anti-sigma regulatory factor (Ser/Thr protein kinase) [Streptosporangium brasiliense]
MMIGLLSEYQVPGGTQAPGQARDWVRDLISSEHPLHDDLVLAVSELVTNAVRHTRSGNGGQVAVGLETGPDYVLVEVRDDGSESSAPQVLEVDELAESGRGMKLLSDRSEAWGVREEAGAKGRTVWFLFMY